ncbi:MAG: hypothetical protein IPK71_33320 [Myxococcales bacterium]|nr:hypothetical protein [Myxococcales bacterium]
MKIRSVIALALVPVLGACVDREEVWDTVPTGIEAVGLTDRVVVVDDSAKSVISLRPGRDQELERTRIAVGANVASVVPSRARDKLFVLSYGDVPRRDAEDERPSLTVIARDGTRRLELSSAHGGLVADPEGRYLAIFAAAQGARKAPASFVENPNEIIIVDLEAPPGKEAVVPRSIRSFGGKPRRVSFSPVVNLPGGPRRLLVVETEQDVTLLDLDRIHDVPERPEITVRLGSGANAKPLSPAGIAIDDGEPTSAEDTRIAIRAANDSSLVLLTLGAAPPGSPNDFFPTVNLTDVGGVAQDIAFVRTDGGPRLAALVPGIRSAVLVEPATGLTQKVDLPEAYSRIALVTRDIGAPTGSSDVALLYGAASTSTQGVAFWSLGKTAGQPYRSLESVPLGTGVSTVLDVPAPRGELKVLESASGTGFFVLDLASRTASPLTTITRPKLSIAPDGQRLWAFPQGGSVISRVELPTLHPVSLPVDRSVNDVFDVTSSAGGASVVAIDVRGTVSATVMDATAVDSIASRTYFGLLLEGLP